ncbi:beta-lactamase-like protein [Gongronella butleri]|nr:beta-lactamase-like protein [Gongronella butleri]
MRAFLKTPQRRLFSTSRVTNMIIKPVPCLKDNYAHVLLDEHTKTAAVVDPVEPEKLLAALEAYPDYQLTTILTTHHHWDHAHGNKKMLELRPGLTVYGGSDNVQAVTHVLGADAPAFEFGALRIQPLTTRGHTMDHVCYYVEDGNDKAVFTGDCLFSSGCGRFFEGTPQDMHNAFSKLKPLPQDTLVYFGHEYTVANCRFLLEHVEPENKKLQEKLAWAQKVGCTTPSTILNELQTNSFLRTDDRTVRQSVAKPGENVDALLDIDVLGRLRHKKDHA